MFLTGAQCSGMRRMAKCGRRWPVQQRRHPRRRETTGHHVSPWAVGPYFGWAQAKICGPILGLGRCGLTKEDIKFLLAWPDPSYDQVYSSSPWTEELRIHGVECLIFH